MKCGTLLRVPAENVIANLLTEDLQVITEDSYVPAVAALRKRYGHLGLLQLKLLMQFTMQEISAN